MTATVAASNSLGPWPIRELTEPDDIREAAEDAQTWGFLRPIEPHEITLGSWFRMGRGVVWWYEPPLEEVPGAAFLHMAVAPRVRGHWPIRRWHIAAQVIAELMGASYLLAQVESPQVKAYLVRLGWREDGPRVYLVLGG